jgi:hypothetical protein
LQWLWATLLGFLDIYALIENFQLRNHWAELFTFGDVVRTTLSPCVFCILFQLGVQSAIYLLYD